ncbi:unnamed protein product [Arctogadus glacialis]
MFLSFCDPMTPLRPDCDPTATSVLLFSLTKKKCISGLGRGRLFVALRCDWCFCFLLSVCVFGYYLLGLGKLTC